MKTINVHSHVLPPCFWNAVAREGHWRGAKVVTREGREYVDTMNRVAGPIDEKWRFTPEERIAHMDQQGVDIHVLSVAPYFTNYHMEPAQGLASAQELNNEVAEMARAHPDRFIGLATVPMQDSSAAAAELERCMQDLGMKGVEINTNMEGHNLDEAQFRPFFEAAERLGAFVFFHPHNPAGSDRTGRYYLTNTIGFPLDTTITIASLIFGGVLDRYPGLKLCFSHGGGYVCFGIGRMVHGWRARPEPKVNPLQHSPDEYLQHLYYDCITQSDDALKYLVDRVGADRVMLGDDFPFDMGFDFPVEWVNSLNYLNSFEKRRILGENAQEVLGVG
ncbi:MAG: amidohydrolase family protein [Dehalococcoidia bacterium]